MPGHQRHRHSLPPLLHLPTLTPIKTRHLNLPHLFQLGPSFQPSMYHHSLLSRPCHRFNLSDRQNPAPKTIQPQPPAIRCLADVDIHRYIGFRHLRDYITIHKCGTDIRVVSQGKPLLLSEAYLTTIERNNKGKPLSRPTHFLEKVGMDIGYGYTDSQVGSIIISLLSTTRG
jgi:hypothetical protein